VYACWVLSPYATYYKPAKLSQLCQLYITSQARNFGMLSKTYTFMVNEKPTNALIIQCINAFVGFSFT
jgi:hypothetical protein